MGEIWLARDAELTAQAQAAPWGGNSLAAPTERAGSYIAVEGPIGVGKSSLARLLADELNARLVLEEVETNPFLSRF